MNYLKITKIEIQNFRSIQTKVSLDIKPGLFSIEGINTSENGSGNGAGKSTIISALYWCLTGNALTNEVLADEIINNKVGKNCQVSLYIDSSAGEVIITRYRKHSEFGNELHFSIAGQDLTCHKVVDTQARINQFIKIPFELLHSTILITHDIKSAFSELSPQQRVQTLESIRDYSIWDKVRDTANSDIKAYNKEINELNLKKSNCDGQLTANTTWLNENTVKLTKLVEESNITKLTAIDTELTNKINTLTTEIESLNKQLETEKTNVIPVDDEAQKNLDAIVEKANVTKLDIQKIEFSLTTAKNTLETVEKWFINDKCPTCGKPFSRTDESIAEMNAKKAEVLKEIDSLNDTKLLKEKSLADLREEWKVLNKSIQEQKDKAKASAAVVTQIESQLKNKTSELNVLNIQLLNNKNNINKYESDKAALVTNQEKYESEIKKLNAEIETYTKEIQILDNKKQLSDYFYKLLGSKGELRPYLLNKDIQYLNACMQKYINRFFKNTTVNLQLSGASIEIQIESDGIKKSISGLSGGEKKRLNLSIQFALYDLLESTSQVSFNTLWLDEIESQLDAQGIQQLIEIIEDRAENIENVMWITNNTMVKENIADKIICKKICGKTEVSYK